MLMALIAVLTWAGGTFYISGKSVLDYAVGKDSFWSRYLNRPLINYLTNGELRTEEQFQAALDYNRRQVKREWVANALIILP